MEDKAEDKIEYQTRRDSGELRFFDNLTDAMADAQDPSVWKLSFGLPDGRRVRFVKEDGKLVFSDAMREALARIKER